MLGVEHTFLSCITDWVGVGAISGCSDVEPGVISWDAAHSRCSEVSIRRHQEVL